MRYSIEGENLPVLKVWLEQGEAIQCEAGAMSWMDNEIQMQTSAGGIGQMFGRMITKENAFMNTYFANQAGEIAFSSKFMMEALKTINSKDIRILLNSDIKPIILKTDEDENLIQLLLPIKTY